MNVAIKKILSWVKQKLMLNFRLFFPLLPTAKKHNILNS